MKDVLESTEMLSGLVDPRELLSRVGPVLSQLEQSATLEQNVLPRLSLLRAALEIIDHFHRAPTAPPICPCGVLTTAVVRSLTSTDERKSLAPFARWLDDFVETYAAHHRPCVACVAARLVRSNPVRRWRVDDLAHFTGAQPARLARLFRREFGLTIAEYVQVTRLAKAFPALLSKHSKVEIVAHDCGYSSKKNFYRALHKWLLRTPAHLRRLPEREIRPLQRALHDLQFKICSMNVDLPARVRGDASFGRMKVHRRARGTSGRARSTAGASA
jgi:AraC-like DNA-binding protein